MWSRMYDNIQESTDCPSEDVIEDDDMLDGWFLIQQKKRDKEKAESDFDKMNNSKLKNADDIFIMAGSQKDVEKIDSMNDTHGKMTKKERAASLRHKGSMEQHEFRDEKLKLRQQSNQQFKDKFGR